MGRTTRINNLILSIFGYSVVHDQIREASHILDVVHFFVNGKGERPHNQEHHVVDIIDAHTQTRPQQQHVVKLKLKRCALRLLTAGVSIKAKLPEDKDNTGFGLSCFSLVWNILCAMLLRLCKIFLVNAIGVDHGIVDSDSYIQMVDDINNYSKAFFIKRMWKTVWNSFTYRQEWLLRFMNHNYNFVATVLSVLTIVQTVYAILTYYFPK
ncbi:hypothetical protein TSUD_42230 [Trifolium subterraneum]|uniref:Uncharacterized protein n=1 Tax=Trifolium subterraneum TaxID=3900 RepID=A0A2Z6MJM3_TRISU|nr:hypothetical protein TSUD_42230 [Trifolium subterraneum]